MPGAHLLHRARDLPQLPPYYFTRPHGLRFNGFLWERTLLRFVMIQQVPYNQRRVISSGSRRHEAGISDPSRTEAHSHPFCSENRDQESLRSIPPPT